MLLGQTLIQIFIDREKMDDGLNKNQSIGYLDFDDKSGNSISSNTLLEGYYKIIYMEKNGSITVDFVEYSSLLFIHRIPSAYTLTSTTK